MNLSSTHFIIKSPVPIMIYRGLPYWSLFPFWALFHFASVREHRLNRFALWWGAN